MTWLDLTIIYLACGAPFAVYRIVLSEHAPKKTAIRSTRAGLLWPFVGAKAVLKRLRSASRSLGRPKLESIRREMETALAAENPHLNTFEFREVFERYTTLATALRSRTALPATTALWNAIGSGSPATSVACVARAQQAKIERHSAAARDEFLRYLLRTQNSRLLELTAAAADELGDSTLLDQLLHHAMSGGKVPSVSIPLVPGSAS